MQESCRVSKSPGDSVWNPQQNPYGFHSVPCACPLRLEFEVRTCAWYLNFRPLRLELLTLIFTLGFAYEEEEALLH